jgi:hypothetical protein
MRGAEARAEVAVDPVAARGLSAPLFRALEAAFPVAFRPLREGAGEAGAFILAATGAEGAGAANAGEETRPTLIVAPPPDGTRPDRDFLILDADDVDRRLRGFSGHDPLEGPSLTPSPDETVIARSGEEVRWTASGAAPHRHRLGTSLPGLAPGEGLRDLFADRALGLIALVELLRRIDPTAPRPPRPIRACLLFDDPNLHRPTYGYIDFEQLVAHADRHGYHASMAMIPLDGRFPHRDTASLFRRRPDRLSLVIHGNNHLSRELMRPASAEEALGLAAQALRRTAAFERRGDVRVGRIMVPPHGMCSAAVARALGVLGYDALCAIHPYPWREVAPAEVPLAGWEPAEFAAGCAVIPRLHLDTDFEEMRIRAFLDQPLVVYGHHNDLAGGLDRLAEVSGRIAGLGEVRWGPLDEIAAANFRAERESGEIVLRPFSHRQVVDVDPAARELTVLAPRDGEDAFAGWSIGDGRRLPFGTPVPVPPGRLELRLVPVAPVDPKNVPAPRPSVWPVVRRFATETRDRLEPLLARSA